MSKYWSTKYYQDNAKNHKKVPERYQILSLKEKKQYGCKQYSNLPKDKEKLAEYRKNYLKWDKAIST